jgi:hypothetical protein
MDEDIDRIAEALLATQKMLAQIIADSAALHAVVRSLAEANVSNPVFQGALKMNAEARAVTQLNSGMTDEQIEAFKRSLELLLPRQLRGG